MVESSREGAAPSSASSEEAAGSVEFEASERLELMESGLPLCIFLESSEVVAMRPPAPLYVFAPRVSYLPTLIDKCHEHFKPYIQPSFGQPTSPFFDFCGVPLDWRLPIGVAFDILSALKGGRARRLASCGEAEPAGKAGLGELAASGCDVELPWRLTIHFHGGAATAGGAPGAPAAPGTPGGPGGPGGRGKQVFGFAEFVGWAGFESFFLNALKQATYVMHGSAVPFQRLPKAAEVQLLAALRAAAVRDFLAGCSQLLPPLTPRHFRRIPVRLYVCGPPCLELSLSFPCFKTPRLSAAASSLEESSPRPPGSAAAAAEAPAAAAAAAAAGARGAGREGGAGSGQALATLGDLVHHVLPHLFPKLSARSQQPAAAAGPRPAREAAAAAAAAAEGRGKEHMKVIQEPGTDIGRRACAVVVHGVQPLLQTPLFWLAATAPQLDMFLHVVVLVDEALVGSA